MNPVMEKRMNAVVEATRKAVIQAQISEGGKTPDYIWRLKAEIDELDREDLSASVESKFFNGIEYVRIPEGVTVPSDSGMGEHQQKCRTVWFRKGVEAEILSGAIPSDFMRCPGCDSMEFEDSDCIDFGSTTCKRCNKEFFDLGWSWMRDLFPDPRVCREIGREGSDSPIKRFLRGK